MSQSIGTNVTVLNALRPHSIKRLQPWLRAAHDRLRDEWMAKGCNDQEAAANARAMIVAVHGEDAWIEEKVDAGVNWRARMIRWWRIKHNNRRAIAAQKKFERSSSA